MSAIDNVKAVIRIKYWGPYGYQPSQIGAITFTVVYGICFGCLTYMAIKRRCWWILATLSLGAALECAGNAIRVYSHYHPRRLDPYIAQETLLVITPAFFAAAQFSILGKICTLFGPRYIYPFKPNWLIPFFVTVDVLSIAIQGSGSGIAAQGELNAEPVDVINKKGFIVLAGLALQLAGYLAFNGIFAMFVSRIVKDPHKGENAHHWNGKMKVFLLATWSSAFFILARSVFRTFQIGAGWIGIVGTTEWYYLVFDATFVSLALIIFVIFSPASYIPQDHSLHHLNDTESLLFSIDSRMKDHSIVSSIDEKRYSPLIDSKVQQQHTEVTPTSNAKSAPKLDTKSSKAEYMDFLRRTNGIVTAVYWR